MDRKGWVMRAVEALRFAEFKDIQRYLDEEGESFSKKELEDTLQALVRAGLLEEKEGVFRPARRKGSGGLEAFQRLFKDEDYRE
jgi:DNA-binding HxlR family transcriptional regulator